jgi:hypothetical protein
VEDNLSTEKKQAQPIKVTDKRIFTAEGEVREEFRTSMAETTPSEEKSNAGGAESAATATSREPAPARPVQASEAEQKPASREPKRSAREGTLEPGTPFTSFVYSLVLQAFMSLGLVRNPYQQIPVEPEAARQLIDIIAMLGEKTRGNLTAEEEEFLEQYLAELKLAYVQVSKKI